MGLLALALALAAEVGLDEEVHEEGKEGHDVEEVHQGDVAGEGAVVLQHVDGLGVHADKLDELQQGDSHLPGRAELEAGQQVVGVHHQVHSAVRQNRKVNVTI